MALSWRYTEQLMEDMGANNQLGVWKGISQIMMPVDSSLYNKLRQELKSQRLKKVNDSSTNEPNDCELEVGS
ncbi:hypothetical protein [Nostoc sp.]|uniref:hypothetical protein n=1 Tax=Nostoc sp. TaxID=1180 RepID=UPI002FFB9DFA